MQRELFPVVDGTETGTARPAGSDVACSQTDTTRPPGTDAASGETGTARPPDAPGAALADDKPRLSRLAAGLLRADHVHALPDDAELLSGLLRNFIAVKDAGWGCQCSWYGSVPTVEAVAAIADNPAALKLSISEIIGARATDRQAAAAEARRACAPRRRRAGLSESRLDRLPPGRHSDGRGHGLLFRVLPARRHSWVQRVTIRGRRADLGLGSWPAVSLADARQQAAENCGLIQQGLDPREERARRAAAPTFKEVAEEELRNRQDTWKSQTTEAAYRVAFDKHLFPAFGDTPVDQISVEQVVAVVRPHWKGNGSAGYRLLQKLTTVFTHAVVRGLRPDNPAQAARQLMPKFKDPTQHHKSVPHAGCEDAVAKIRAARLDSRVDRTLSALALELVVLTALRTSEVLGAEWSEIDLECRTWTIPAIRMKAQAEHRVPLSVQAVAVLERAREVVGGDDDDDRVFAFRVHGRTRTLARNSMARLARRLDLGGVPHGFRSSFRDWCSEVAQMPADLAELCLAHGQKDRTVRAYARSDLLERRRSYMQQWADYVVPRKKTEEA